MKYNKEKILMIVGIITLIVFVGGATFAYFVAQDGNAEQTNINVTTHTTDSLVFEVGKAISITADQTTFAPGAGNRSDNTFARTMLKANSSTNSATENYNVYLIVEKNEFSYTTEEKTPELILSIAKKSKLNGAKDETLEEVTILDNLNYVTVGEVSGFDITEVEGEIVIENKHQISTTSETIEEYEITLTLVNLDANQNANTGKNLDAKLLIQQEETFVSHIKALYTTQGANNLYYHNGTITDAEGNILDAEDKSYRYSGGDYTIDSAYQETYKRITKKAITDTDALLGFICGTNEVLATATCNEEIEYFYLTYEEGENKTQYETYKEALAKLIEDGYLLDTPVKNYVCFGSDEEICPEDNLYRILGVINGKTKLIKADFAGENLIGEKTGLTITNYNPNQLYYGNKKSFNRYRLFDKTTTAIFFKSIIYTDLLNIDYLNNFEEHWIQLIGYTKSYGNINGNVTAKKSFEKMQSYNYSRITLTNVSEFMYSVQPSNWNIITTKYDEVRDNNWMFIGGCAERTTNKGVNVLNYSGISNVGTIITPVSTGYFGIRPVFSLAGTTKYVSGTGTSTDPYRIA